MLLPFGEYLYPSIGKVFHNTIDPQVGSSTLHCLTKSTISNGSLYKGMYSYFRAYQDISFGDTSIPRTY